jgi:hypothetical protein
VPQESTDSEPSSAASRPCKQPHEARHRQKMQSGSMYSRSPTRCHGLPTSSEKHRLIGVHGAVVVLGEGVRLVVQGGRHADASQVVRAQLATAACPKRHRARQGGSVDLTAAF